MNQRKRYNFLTNTGGVAVDTWCMAKPDRNPRALQVALDWACANGADCEPVKQGGLCFEPNNADAHACYAMNSYYQNNLRAPATCDFNGLARVILVNVSYGTCLYPLTPKFPSPPPPPPYGRKTIQGKQRGT